MLKNITFGSDPEYFIKNKETGKIVSSIGIVEGTKEYPEALSGRYSILTDNILVEGNVPPTSVKEDFVYTMKRLKELINNYIQSKYPILEVHHADCLVIDMAFLSHPDAMQFGCSPFINAWDKKIHKAKDLSSESYRTAGCHIHYGYDIEENVVWSKGIINNVFARAFDLFLTIPSCLIHVDERRFTNYGGLGQYRETTYGLECRSLGGYFANPEYASWIFDQSLKLIEYIEKEENLYHLMYLEKPRAEFKGGIFTHDSSIYDELNINFNEQLIKSNKTIYV